MFFEHHSEPLASGSVFFRRLVATTSIGLMVLMFFVFAGMLGFHAIDGLDWMDSFLNAAMLVGGMGPIEHERCAVGKLFEGLYAVICGVVVITAAGVILSPVVHRLLHKFHLNNHHR